MTDNISSICGHKKKKPIDNNYTYKWKLRNALIRNLKTYHENTLSLASTNLKATDWGVC